MVCVNPLTGYSGADVSFKLLCVSELAASVQGGGQTYSPRPVQEGLGGGEAGGWAGAGRLYWPGPRPLSPPAKCI